MCFANSIKLFAPGLVALLSKIVTLIAMSFWQRTLTPLPMSTGPIHLCVFAGTEVLKWTEEQLSYLFIIPAFNWVVLSGIRNTTDELASLKWSEPGWIQGFTRGEVWLIP